MTRNKRPRVQQYFTATEPKLWFQTYRVPNQHEALSIPLRGSLTLRPGLPPSPLQMCQTVAAAAALHQQEVFFCLFAFNRTAWFAAAAAPPCLTLADIWMVQYPTDISAGNQSSRCTNRRTRLDHYVKQK